MTELRKADDNSISKPKSNKTLAQLLKMQKHLVGDACLLLDISGSMSADVEPGQRRIDVLRSIVKSLPGSPKTIAFHTIAEDCDKNNIPEPTGSTFMGRAFARAKELGFKNAVMITDGEASDKISALDAVNGLSLKIIYVGGGNKPEFLDELAQKAGGYCTQKDLHMPKEIEGELQRLLSPPDAAASGDDGSIKL